jgi:hypothetical protein
LKSLVVYESMFGNTRDLAEAIAAELQANGEAGCMEVDAVGPSDLAGVDLLVVGGPTHVWGLSRAFSRRSAAGIARSRLVSKGRALRDWLHSLEPVDRAAAAAFDTRLDELRLSSGSAARVIARRLRRKGYSLVAKPASFRVEDAVGPLTAGELERARAWATSLIEKWDAYGASFSPRRGRG